MKATVVKWSGASALALVVALNTSQTASGAVWRNPRTGASFDNDVAAFGKADQTNPPPRNAILFLGASSMRLWKTLAQDLPEYRVINRGFGGSQITDVIHYMDRVVLPYSPPVIVYHPGADAGNPPETVLADFKAFVTKVHSNLPTTHIVVLAISAQPANSAAVLDRAREANRLIKEFANTEPRLSFIDAFSEMLGPDGRPKPEIFHGDGRHLNERGYALWTTLIRKHLAGLDAASSARKASAITSVASLSALAEPSVRGVGKPDFSKARKSIQERLSRIPSISVAVARNGEVLWEEGFGWADRENGTPVTEHTLYYTASVTKSFTATALMILYERNKLDLDRPVNDYLARAKLSSPAWNPDDATVRRVVNHTAGLTTFNASKLPIDEAIRRYGVLFWPPGEHFDYSNLGPKVLEEVIAEVSGRNYADFLRDEVFRPLGITRASAGFEPALEKHTARAYNAATGDVVPPPGGGIYCSAHDLLRFGMFHLKTRAADQKAILSDRSIDAMQNETVNAGSKGRYGLAWWVEENRFGYRSVLAQGGTDAAQAWLRLIPSEGIAVALLCNSGNSSVKSVVDEILSTLLPVYAEESAKPPTTAPQPAAQAPFPPFVGSWKGFVKTFRGHIPVTFSIPESGEVQLQLGSQPATILDQTKFNEKRLAGITSGKLAIGHDAGAQPHKVEFCLYLRDGALKGAAVTRSSSSLPYWAELKRESQRAGQSP